MNNISDKFSIDAFNKLDPDSQESKDLHNELEELIAERIHESIQPVFGSIAQELKSLGHNITQDKPEYDSEYKSWSYEHRNHNDKDTPRIWLNTQLGVMTGYIADE